MARQQLVQAELRLNSDDYKRNLKDASKTTEQESERMTDSIEEHSDAVQSTGQRTLRINNETSRSYGVLRASTTADMDKIRQATRTVSTTTQEVAQDVVQDLNRIEDANNNLNASSTRTTASVRGNNQRISASSNGLAGDISADVNNIRTSNTRLTASVSQTADETTEDLDDIGEGFDNLAERTAEASEKVADVGKNIVGTVVGISTAVGTAGYMAYTKSEDATSKIQASLRMTREEAEKFEEKAKNLSFKGFEYEDTVNGLIAIKSGLDKVLDEKQLDSFTQGALYLNKVFELDIADTVKASNSMMQNFGIDGAQSLDIITWGFQNGLDISKDFVDTLHEYAPQMKKLGFTAEETLQVINSGMEAGAFNTDKLLDGVKEFRLRLSDIDDTGAGALEKLGLKTEDVQKAINKGGDSAKNMALKVSLALSKVKDDTERNSLSIALFGTQFEDVGDAIYEGLNKAKTPIADLVTSTESLVDAYKDNPAQKMKGLTEQIQASFRGIGEDLMPYVLDVMEAIRDVVQYFADLSPETKKTIVIVLGIVAAFGAFLVVLGTLIGVSLAVAGAIATFSVWGPIAGIITAVGLALSGLIALITMVNWELFIEGGKSIFKFLGNLLITIFQAFMQAIGTIVMGFFTWLYIAYDYVGQVIHLIGLIFSNFGGVMMKVIEGALKNIVDFFKLYFDYVKEDLKLSFDFIKALFSGDFDECFKIVQEKFGNMGKFIKDMFDTAWKNIKDTVDKIKDLLNFEWKFPDIKVPKFEWTGSWNLLKGETPKMNVVWHAKGGIYKKPTLFNTASGVHGVGEAGAEAILPLDKLPDLLGLNDKNAGDVILNIKEFNNNTKQDIEQLTKEIAFSLRRKGVIA